MDWFLYNNGLRHERVKLPILQNMLTKAQIRRELSSLIFCKQERLYDLVLGQFFRKINLVIQFKEHLGEKKIILQTSRFNSCYKVIMNFSKN